MREQSREKSTLTVAERVPDSQMPHPRAVARELWRGKSILRSIGNATLEAHRSKIGGRVLDLGSGKAASYRRLVGSGLHWISIDRNVMHAPDIVADMEATLPLRSLTFDTVILSWALYIAANPNAVIAEAARILRPGGYVVLATPFVFPEAPEPTDYWRFTAEGLRLILMDAGLGEVRVIPLGGRF